jgi:hypothetical protein
MNAAAWTGAFLSLAFIGLLLAQIAWLVAAQWCLNRAAGAACREAALPRATLAAAERAGRTSLGEHTPLGRRAHLVAEIARRAGRPSGELDLCSGDAVTIRLSARAGSVMPAWLSRGGLPLDGVWLVGSATRRRP